MEIWKAIPDMQPYEASQCGKIRNAGTGRILKQMINVKGYPCLSIWKGIASDPSNIRPKGRTWTVHKLIALAYIGPRPLGAVINHIDANQKNNHYTNLEYISNRDNVLHAVSLGRMQGSKHRRTVLKEEDVRKIRELIDKGYAFTKISLEYGCSPSTIRDIRTGRCWKHLR